MKPPEKIFITPVNPITLANVYVERSYPELLEYHLAHVWHDAVKEPPKEADWYLTINNCDSMRVVYCASNGRWMMGTKEVNVEYYQHLPLPPERSGE